MNKPGELPITDAAELLKTLPASLRSKIRSITKRTGESAVEIVQKGVDLYWKTLPNAKSGLVKPSDPYALDDPAKRTVFSQVMKEIAVRASSAMTAEQREERAKKGADGRHASTTPEQRREIARKAGLESAKSRREKKLKEQ